MRIRFVGSYLELAFGERGFMKSKNKQLIKIQRTKEGNFKFGWGVSA